jgi:hypothetical protein
MCPGPQNPLYLLGRKMLHCYPYVPIGGEMCLNCAILTYNGTAYFGFSGEVHAVPDLGRLEALLQLSFAELRKAAGIKNKTLDKERSDLGKEKRPNPRCRQRLQSRPALGKAVCACGNSDAIGAVSIRSSSTCGCDPSGNKTCIRD